MIIIPPAPALHGTANEQIYQLQRYIIDLTDVLSISLNNINYDSFDKETRDMIGGGHNDL